MIFSVITLHYPLSPRENLKLQKQSTRHLFPTSLIVTIFLLKQGSNRNTLTSNFLMLSKPTKVLVTKEPIRNAINLYSA